MDKLAKEEQALLQEIRNVLGSMLANSKSGMLESRIKLICRMDETFGTTTDPRDGKPIKGKLKYMREYLYGSRPLPYTNGEEE